MERRPGPARLEVSPAAALYERYATTVLTYLRRRLPSREDAEDMLLEVFLAAFERNSLIGLAEEERSAWLRQVARNKLTDFYRRAGRRSSVALDGVEDLLYDEALDPEQVALWALDATDGSQMWCTPLVSAIGAVSIPFAVAPW